MLEEIRYGGVGSVFMVDGVFTIFISSIITVGWTRIVILVMPIIDTVVKKSIITLVMTIVEYIVICSIANISITNRVLL